MGVWLFDDGDLETLRLEHLYVASTRTHSEGEVLVVSSAPRYREALHAKKAIVADDAWNDPITRGLRASYLEPLGITSMLDAPLFLRGRVAGVICHEHVGAPRRWTPAEIDFACTIADTASLVCEQGRRLLLERELRERVVRGSAVENMETVTLLARSLAHELGNVFTATRLGTDQLAKMGEAPMGVAHMSEADMGELQRGELQRGGLQRGELQRGELQRGELQRSEGGARELATAVGEALSVGERLVTDLRRFADRASTDPPRARSLAAEVIVRFRPVLELLVRGHAQLALEVDPSVTVGLDDTALEQVILNLVLNARDALASVGRMGTIRLAVERSGERAIVSVSDDGPGIPDALRAQLGRGYVTTKAHGTGIGLTVARKLAQAAHGELVIAEVPRGARVELQLPLG